MGAVLAKVLGDGKPAVPSVNGAVAPRVNAVPVVAAVPALNTTRKNNARNNILVPVAEESVNVITQAGGKRKSKRRSQKKRQTKRRR